MDKIKWQKTNRYAKKLKAINYLGGKCENCGEDNYYKLCFHHKEQDEKDFTLNELVYHRWSMIEKELKKCSLLCFNCHHEIHYDINGNKTKNKKILLEYISINKCEYCNYDKSTASLDFHHLEPDNKIVGIGRLLLDKGIYDIKNDIEDELNKCIVLCKNCHMDHHFNDGYYKENYDEILMQSENIKEIQLKIDRNLVEEMYNSGMKQIEIARYFNASKGTISNIIKKASK